MRQELGAVGGCSTHLGGEGKYNSRNIKKTQCRGYSGVGRVHTVTVRKGVELGLELYQAAQE